MKGATLTTTNLSYYITESQVARRVSTGLRDIFWLSRFLHRLGNWLRIVFIPPVRRKKTNIPSQKITQITTLYIFSNSNV